MVHRNAPLTETGRLRLARCIVEQCWPVARAAERFQVARPTAKRWSDGYRQLGPAGMVDRSSRPHRSNRRTPQPIVRKIVHLRWKQRLGPVAIAARTGRATSTVHRILVDIHKPEKLAQLRLGLVHARAGCWLGHGLTPPPRPGNVDQATRSSRVRT